MPANQNSKSKEKLQIDNEGERLCIIHTNIGKDEVVKPLTDKTLSKIKEVVSIIQESSCKDEELEKIVDNFPEQIDHKVHGFHQKCYKKY